MSQKPNQDFHLARLLAERDEATAAEADVIRHRVHRSLARARRSARVRWAWLAAAGVAATSLFVLFTPADSGYRVKGDGHESKLEIACDSVSGRCDQSNQLLFRATGLASERYLSAFSRRQDGTIIWYFPGKSSPQSHPLSDVDKDGILSAAVLLGDEHPPGEYELFALFSPSPLSADTIRAVVQAGNAGDGEIRIVRRRWVVEPQQ